MKTVYIDIETYSDNDIKHGVHKYVDSVNFEILLLAYAVDDSKPCVIDIKNGDTIDEKLKAILIDPSYIKTAYNANFELTCLSKVFPELIKPEQWECDMVLAQYHSIGGGLGAVAKALGLPEDKQKDARGKRLIQFFCKPCKPSKKNGGRTRNLPEHDPEAWEVFKEYNAQDVITERAIREKLVSIKPPAEERELWLLDRRINCRGVAIDIELAAQAIKLNEAIADKLTAEAKELTGLENPNSPSQLKDWLKLNGHPVDSLGKDTVAEMLQKDTLHPALKQVLQIRQLLGKTSIKKYVAMMDSICKDGRAHDLFQFYGASRTGRWAGRNIQLQNLPRNYIADLDDARNAVKAGDLSWLELLYDNVPDLLSQLIRTAIVPAKGYKFIVADFSAIEARVIAWLAGEHWVLDAFREGKDIYCATASQMFGVPVEKHGINGELRQKGKVATLACGYGGGINALKAMGADKMGLSDEELQHIVDKWRLSSPHITEFWHRLELAAVRAIKRGIPAALSRGVTVMRRQKNLLIKLPSGRSLFYQNARMGENRWGNPSIIYSGLSQTTKKFEDLETYGGKLAENVTQAVARDCLAVSMVGLEREGYKIVAHIHDEVVLEVPDNDDYSLNKAVEIMTRPAPWASGLPLNAAGFESYYYKKD